MNQCNWLVTRRKTPLQVTSTIAKPEIDQIKVIKERKKSADETVDGSTQLCALLSIWWQHLCKRISHSLALAPTPYSAMPASFLNGRNGRGKKC